MARNISCYHTQEQIRQGTKTQTRRCGWRFVKKGDILMFCEKCQGLKKGERIVRIRPVRVTQVRRERIDAITQQDVIAEGFPDWSPDDFIRFYCEMNQQRADELCTVICFEYLTRQPASRTAGQQAGKIKPTYQQLKITDQ